MRGKVLSEMKVQIWYGITPAYAGKRLLQFQLCIHNQDHPRLCGEKAKETKEFSGELGSPPPMRGKVRCFRVRP